MKAIKLGPVRSELPGDYAPPHDKFRESSLLVVGEHLDPSGVYLGFKLFAGGAGIWDRTNGRLVAYDRTWADLAWIRQGAALLVLENRFLTHARGKSGVVHAISHRTSDGKKVLDCKELIAPTGGLESVVLNTSETLCLATWLDQSSWGYLGIEVDTLKPIPTLQYSFPSPTLSLPIFSPASTRVLSCNFLRYGWWTRPTQDYYEDASPGGVFDMGVISLQDTKSGRIVSSTISVRLPRGWQPQNCADDYFHCLDSPIYVDDDEFSVRLPDGSRHQFQPPLPPRFVLTQELSRERL